MLGSAVVGDRLYIFGGDTIGGWTNETWSAPIKPDAQLGEWRAEKALPERRSYLSNCTEVVNNRIYLVGGMVAADAKTTDGALQRVRDVLWTTVQPDGTLADWKRSEPWPGTTLNLPATCSTEKFLLVTGGSSNRESVDQVLLADFAADGSPTNWRQTTKLPEKRYFHGAGMLENRVYLWTGLPNRGESNLHPLETVYSTEVKDSGELGEWRQETSMVQAVYSSVNCALNDYLISVAGRYVNGYPTNGIWFSRVDAGKVQQWQQLKTDLETRVYHTLALDRTHGWVYIVGGREKTVPGVGGGRIVDAVQAFRLTQPEGSKLKSTEVKADGKSASMNENLEQALKSATGGKTVLAYFYAPEVPACKRAWEKVLLTSAYQQLASKYVLAAVDITAPGAQQAMGKYSVYRVPALLEISGDGKVLRRSTGFESMQDVEVMLKK